MRRRLIGACGAALVFAALAAPAAAQPEVHPSQGEHSEVRNIHGTGFGPHCHVVVAASGQGPFEFIAALPSHTAHVATNDAQGSSAVFQADPNCDGDPGM